MSRTRARPPPGRGGDHDAGPPTSEWNSSLSHSTMSHPSTTKSTRPTPAMTDLHLERDAERSQNEPDERLGTGLGAGVDQLPEHPMSARQKPEQIVEFIRSEHSALQGGVDGRECRARCLAASAHATRRMGSTEVDTDVASDAISPSAGGATSGRRGSSAGVMQVHVQRRRVQNEDAEMRECRHARETPAEVQRIDDIIGWRIRRKVGTRPRPEEPALGDRRREVPGLSTPARRRSLPAEEEQRWDRCTRGTSRQA